MKYYFVVLIIYVCDTFFIEQVDCAGELGSWCDWDYDCTISLSTCIDGFCACDDMHVVDPSGVKCVVETGELCTVKDECKDEHASCQKLDPGDMFNSTSKCLCKESYVLHPTSHVCAVKVDSACNKTADCAAGTCSAQTQKCTCTGALLPNAEGSKCLPGVGASCTTECADSNANCEGAPKICICKPKFEKTLRNDIDVCLKKLTYDCAKGELCADLNASCMQINRGGTVYYGKCWCKPTFLANAAKIKCIPVADKFDAVCEEDIQCKAFAGEGAICKDGKCVCDSTKGFIFNDNENQCMQSCACSL